MVSTLSSMPRLSDRAACPTWASCRYRIGCFDMVAGCRARTFCGRAMARPGRRSEDGEQNGRVLGAGNDVVVRGVGIQVCEVLGDIRIAELAAGDLAAGHPIEAHHVQHRGGAHGGTEAGWRLGDAGADKDAAVAAPLDAQGRRRAVPVVLEVVGRGQEVVEDVLLGFPHAGPVPGLAVLAAAPDVGDGVHATGWTQATAVLR